MSNILIRGLPPRLHKEIQRLAKEENLSVNQMLVRLIQEAVKQAEERREKVKRREQVFDRVMKLREEIYRTYGSFDDSTRLIREDRDSR